jgi:predicted helicase
MGVGQDRSGRAYRVEALTGNIQRTLDCYNLERMRWKSARQKSLDQLSQDGTKIKWSSSLKAFLQQDIEGTFNSQDIRMSLYRPFTTQLLYFNSLLTHRRGRLPRIFPTAAEDGGNILICVPGPGNRKQFGALATKFIPALDLAFEKAQCFPFYTFAKDGRERRENISDQALEQFRIRYADLSLTKWDLFDYIYAILHHPEYCERYAERLGRELPRIPFVSVPPGSKDADDLFRRLATAGRRLREIHVNYEQQPEFALTKTEKIGEKLDWRVTKMRLAKDKTSLVYNQFLTLSGIPAETHDYRIGNRSALEWIIDQYRTSTDKRSGIVNDPNRADDPTYILRLIGRIITISIETVQLVRSLPPLALG